MISAPYRVHKSIAERFSHKYGSNCIFFIAHAQNGLISTPCQKSDVTIVFADPDFLYDAGIWRFGHKYGPNCIFFIAHAQNGLISTSCQKSDVTVVFKNLQCAHSQALSLNQRHKNNTDYHTHMECSTHHLTWNDTLLWENRNSVGNFSHRNIPSKIPRNQPKNSSMQESTKSSV